MGPRRGGGIAEAARTASRAGAGAVQGTQAMTPDQHHSRELLIAWRGGDDQRAAGGNEHQGDDDTKCSQSSALLPALGRAASVGKLRLAAVDALEEVIERLDRLHPGVRPVAGSDLSRERLRDTCSLGDCFPPRGGDRAETSDKGLQERTHGPFFPVFGNSSIRLREKIPVTLPTKRNNEMQSSEFWRGRIFDEEPYEMASPPARAVLADNLKALMKANPKYSKLIPLEQATATRGGGKRIGKTTLANILAEKTPVNLDYVEVLAKVFNLDPWQMLVPGLRPENPQILRSTGPEEDALYTKLGELRVLAKQIDALEAERELPEAIQDEQKERPASKGRRVAK